MDYFINMLARPEQITTGQMDEKNVDKAMSIYLKNSVVSLCSAKNHNRDIECLLYVNFDIGDYFTEIFKKNDIKIRRLAFGKHSMGTNYNWDIVNYRYDVMRDLIANISVDDRAIIIDTDTICVASLTSVYNEIDSNLLLFDVQHSIDHIDRKAILDNYQRIYRRPANVTHYGGEFIGANGLLLKELYQSCNQVINDANNIPDLLRWNDEHITSIAVNKEMSGSVHNANQYIYRYWTGRGFYLASTNYIFNPVSIWHVPNEKKYGFIKIFDYFMEHNRFPELIYIAKQFGFPKAKRPFSFRFYLGRTLNRIKQQIEH